MTKKKTRSREGWTRVRFGDVVTNVNDQPKRVSLPLATRYVAGEHVDESRLRIDRWGTLGDELVPPTFRRRFGPSDVLFHSRNLKKIAVPDFGGITGEKLFVLRSTSPNLLQDFLPYVLLSPAFTAYAESSWSGSVNKFLNWTPLAKYEFDLPPVEEQRRNIALGTTIRNAVDSYGGLSVQARRTKHSILSKLSTPSPSDKQIRIEDICTVVRGSSPRPAGDARYFNGSYIPWITVGEVTKDEWPYLEGTQAMLTQDGAHRSRKLKAGTVVLTNSGFSLGVPKILSITGCANDGIAAFLDLDASVMAEFLYYSLFSKTQFLRDVIAAGGDQPNLNTTLIGKLTISLPPIAKQTEIVNALKSIDCLARDARARSASLNSLISSALMRFAGDANAV